MRGAERLRLTDRQGDACGEGGTSACLSSGIHLEACAADQRQLSCAVADEARRQAESLSSSGNSGSNELPQADDTRKFSLPPDQLVAFPSTETHTVAEVLQSYPLMVCIRRGIFLSRCMDVSVFLRKVTHCSSMSISSAA